MKVKIGDKIYNSKDLPIMVILSEEDKSNISNMAKGNMKYCVFPDIERWMDDIPKEEPNKVLDGIGGIGDEILLTYIEKLVRWNYSVNAIINKLIKLGFTYSTLDESIIFKHIDKTFKKVLDEGNHDICYAAGKECNPYFKFLAKKE